MDNLRRLEEIFAHFPGIGPRQAKRFAYYLLSKSPSFIKEFTQLIEDTKKSSSECSLCHRLFIYGSKGLVPSANSLAKGTLCSICSNKERDQSTLMVVA